ncbi:MAG: prephenate dehydratase [Vicinamibacterales bacterium]
MGAEIGGAAYQGSPGAYSEEAAWALVGRRSRLLPCISLADVFETVVSGRATHGILPVENSLAGTVPRAYELLLDGRLTAIGETRVRIDHALIGHPSSRVDRIRRVLSHPVALDQCTKFFRLNPGVEAVPVFDTAGAVAMVMENGRGDTAAIANHRAAELHAATVLAERIQDHEDNWTRFLLLAPTGSAQATVTAQKVIVAFRLPHEPGSLCRALQEVADGGVNLTKIESRPIQERPFEYAFLIEMAGAIDAGVDWQGLLTSLRSMTQDLRVLGAF